MLHWFLFGPEKHRCQLGVLTLRICWRVSMESICSICKREERFLLTLCLWKQFMIQQCVKRKAHKKFMKNNMERLGNKMKSKIMHYEQHMVI